MKTTRIKPDTLKQRMKRQYEEWHENILNDEELYTRTLERFEEFLDDLECDDVGDLLEIVNTYKANQELPLIYYNEDMVLDDNLNSASEALQATGDGEFNYYDEFVSFDPLISYNSIPYIFDIGDIFIDILDFPDKYDVDLMAMSEDEYE